MSKLDEKREQLERAYKVASRHYQRILADLTELKFVESNCRDEYNWLFIAYNLLDEYYEKFVIDKPTRVKPDLIETRKKQKAYERLNKTLNKLKKIKARVKQYESIHLSALIKLQDYMESIGEPVV